MRQIDAIPQFPSLKTRKNFKKGDLAATCRTLPGTVKPNLGLQVRREGFSGTTLDEICYAFGGKRLRSFEGIG